MNPLSEQECEVSKEEVEKRLKEKFGTDRPSVDPVPEFLPKVTSKMNDLHVSAQDLRNALKGKKGKASPGEDKVNYAMLREAMACEELAKYITDGINRVLSGDEEIPPEWGDIRIRLVFKGKGSTLDFYTYRPLAITSIRGKVLNAVIKDKLLEHCRRNSVIHEGIQKGFLPNVSGCIDHIAAMMSIIRNAREMKKEFYALLLDLKAAYDSVPTPSFGQSLSTSECRNRSSTT